MHKPLTCFFLALILPAITFSQLKMIQPSPDVKEIQDVSYYDGKDRDSSKHLLDLYLPTTSGPHPVLLWIHGGAWAVGSRKQEIGVARNFARHGIAVAAMSYRLSPGVWIDPKLDKGISHPEHIRDVARATKWIHDHGKGYGIDIEKIIPGGYSAGGHLSALLVMDESYLKEVDLDFTDVWKALPVAGGYDLVDYYHDMVDEGGEDFAHQHVHVALGKDFDELRAASPLTYLESSIIPMLVVSETDTYGYTKILEDATSERAMPHIEYLHVTDKNHNQLFFDMSGNPDSKYVMQMADWILGK